MSKKKKVWSHKRYGKNWSGTYGREKKTNERVFLLIKEGRNTKGFGSHEAAKKSGWTCK